MTRLSYFILVVVLVAVGAAGYWWYRASRTTPASEHPISVSAVRTALLRQAKILFPAATSSVPVAPPDVPTELRALILPLGTEPEAFAMMYADGRTGYRIEFRIVAKLADLHVQWRALIESDGWSFLNSSKGDGFAFIEAENARYQLRVETLKLSTAHVVTIQAMTK